MTMELKAWFADVNLRLIDVDRAPAGNPYQCWDLVQDYLTRVLGGGSLQTGPSPHAGYAIGCWDGFASNGLSQWFSQAPASATMLPGWVPVWKYGQVFTPFSHIAVGVKELPGGMLQCMTQNPGPAHYAPIPKAGLAGYLVPKNGSGMTVTNAYSPDDFVKDLAKGAGGAVADAANNPVGQALITLANINHYLTQPENWKRIGIMALGIVMLLITVLILLGKTPAVQTAVKELA
jgi:hypothetical protein